MDATSYGEVKESGIGIWNSDFGNLVNFLNG